MLRQNCSPTILLKCKKSESISLTGYVSYRHPDTGSWFIENMVTVLRDYSEKVKSKLQTEYIYLLISSILTLD